jgi:hypothetical protein
MWYLPSERGTVIELFNSITYCLNDAALLSDSANVSLAQAAFGPSLYRVGAPLEIPCPAVNVP